MGHIELVEHRVLEKPSQSQVKEIPHRLFDPFHHRVYSNISLVVSFVKFSPYFHMYFHLCMVYQVVSSFVYCELSFVLVICYVIVTHTRSFFSLFNHPDVFEHYETASAVLWVRGQLKCDGTRAETRFRLSAKRTRPFKSSGALVQSTTGSRGVRISCSNAGCTMFRGSVKGTEGYWRVPFASFPFTSAPMRHRVPSHFNWSLLPPFAVFLVGRCINI